MADILIPEISALLLIISVYTLMYLSSWNSKVSEARLKILHAYRKKYGFDRTCEIADLSKKKILNTAKVNKRLDTRERIHNKNVNAELPKQNNETMFEFIKRRIYKV